MRKLIVLLVAFSSLAVVSCKTIAPTPDHPAPVPALTGVIDCALPSLWKVVSFATLVPILEHAVAQSDPYGAIEDAVERYGEAEAACVVASIHDTGIKQAISSPSSTVVSSRVNITAEWLKRERSKGLEPANYDGQVN